MIFSYLLAGAVGVLFDYVSYQLRDSHDEHQNEKQVNLIAGMIFIFGMDSGSAFSSDFLSSWQFRALFDQLKLRFLDFTQRSNSADLYVYASCALSGMSVSGETAGVPLSAQIDPTSTDVESERLAQAGELQALQALLERSQVIWLVVLSLLHPAWFANSLTCHCYGGKLSA